MVEIYNENDYTTVSSQRKKFITAFVITLVALIIIDAGVFVYYTFLEYDTPLKAPLLAFEIVVSAVYAVVYYILFAVKFKRINSYYKMLGYFKSGLTETGRHPFVRVDGSMTEKDGVRFISLVFLEWSDKKQDYFERNILFDVEKPLPDFKNGDIVVHKTQGNVLVAYELNGDDDEIFG